MSKTEILAELPSLRPEERREVMRRLWELQERGLLEGERPTERERQVLDEALAAFEADGDAGRPWREVMREIRTERAG